jgi:hypothetical protein
LVLLLREIPQIHTEIKREWFMWGHTMGLIIRIAGGWLYPQVSICGKWCLLLDENRSCLLFIKRQHHTATVYRIKGSPKRILSGASDQNFRIKCQIAKLSIPFLRDFMFLIYIITSCPLCNGSGVYSDRLLIVLMAVQSI